MKDNTVVIIWEYRDETPIVDLIKLGRTNRPVYYLELGDLNIVLSGGSKRELTRRLKGDDLIEGSIKEHAKEMTRII